MENSVSCPICGHEYKDGRKFTHHHIFPLAWYKNSKLKVEVCSFCHQEFNHNYPMDMKFQWSKKTCVCNWINFCKSKGKNAFEIYPEFLKEIVG